MAKIPSIKPFNITQYAKRNKFNVSNSMNMSDGSKIYFLSGVNKLQCLNISKEGNLIGANCAQGSVHVLMDTIMNVLRKIQ